MDCTAGKGIYDSIQEWNATFEEADDGPQSVEDPDDTHADGDAELPQQGEVSEIPGAPPVDAGKQGKHVSGHKNNDPNKSQWKLGENGVKQTQEAWKNSRPHPKNPNIRFGTSNDGRTIKIHVGKKAIHGYPIFP